MLMLVSGLGLAADTVELFVIPYILPSAEVELCIDESQKGWLSKYPDETFLNVSFSILEPRQLSGIALGYGLNDRRFETRQGLGIFLFTTASR
jgi:hypothetical protein